MAQRFYYVCNVFEESVRSLRDIMTDSPAATAKVSRVCKAVRKAGGDARIVSLGRGRVKGTWKWYPATARRIGKVPIIYLDYWDFPVLTHLITFLSLCVMMFRLTRRNSVLIFYNPQFHYLGALVMGRLLGRRCILDIEDGCRNDDHTLRSLPNALLLKVYNRCCNGGAMLASMLLRQQTPAGNTHVCYGVAEGRDIQRDWSRPPLQVLFGGSLLEDTGAALFLEALDCLRQNFPGELKGLRFVVTGFGCHADHVQRAAAGDMRDFLSFRGKVTNKEYRELLHGSHVGLCLKLPSRSMGATTFPSKVVELSSYGLLLVSTRVSDVPVIFDDTTAILLDEATPHALANALAQIARNSDRARHIAAAGRERIASLLSEERVGSELLAFWQGTYAGTNPGRTPIEV